MPSFDDMGVVGSFLRGRACGGVDTARSSACVVPRNSFFDYCTHRYINYLLARVGYLRRPENLRPLTKASNQDDWTIGTEQLA